MKKVTKKSIPKKIKPLPVIVEKELATGSVLAPIEPYSRFKHMANPGDIIASLAACKKYYEITKRKIVYQQMVNQPAAYYAGAIHGTVDESGVMVTLNNPMFDMIKPLVESQEYIKEFIKYDGQEVHINLDIIRGQTNVNMPHGMLPAWYIYAWPDLACDLSEAWLILPLLQKPLEIQKQVRGKVILNFTERYRDQTLDYNFLKNYSPDLVFAGTEREYWLFCNKWGLTIERLNPKNFLEMAYALSSCRFLMSNQSFLWNICEAAKLPRLLEVCKWADNCQPMVGKNSYGYFYQVGAEYYFRRMYNETSNPL